MPKFKIHVVSDYTLEIPEEVIERGLSDEFAEVINRISSREGVAEHIAHCMINCGTDTLGTIDGFADMDQEICLTEGDYLETVAKELGDD